MFPRPAHFIARIVFFATTLMSGATCGAEATPSRYDRVEVAPTKTSIYVGRVTMTMPTFVRAGAAYETTYTAKVLPFFFYNESGRLTIDISDEMLRDLDRGEAIEFKGRGVSTTGEERHVEGKVTPTNAIEGKIKVRVFVTKRIELIFNTTYRLVGAPLTPPLLPPPSPAAK